MATEFIEISEEEYQGGAGDFIEITEEEFNAPAEELDQPFFAVEDVVSAIGTIPEALSVGVPAAFQKLVTGTAMPEESEAMEKDIAFQERMRQEQQDRQAAGKSSMVGEAIREAAPSIATSFGGLGAGIAGAVGGTVVGGPVGATVGGMAASGTASYRMAAADLLYRSFKALEEQKGSPLTEDEKAQAYKEFLPLAQNSALWEAGPEAVSNAVLLGAGKFVFGFGKPLAKKLVGESIERVNKGIASKVAAGTGAVATELGTETITAVGQFPAQAKAEQFVKTGTTEGAPTEYPGGAMQAFKDVAPATLALTGMMAGAGGVAKAATLPFPKAKTPEQIEEDNINLDADREADNLLIPDNDTESKSIKSQIDTERADLAIKKELYNTLPDGDKTKAVLATEIKEYEGRITGLDNTLRQRLGLSLPITTAEQQQIELAKAITAKPKTEEELRSRFDELKLKAEGTKQSEQTLPDGTKVAMPAVEGQLLSLEEGGEYRQLKQKFEPTSVTPAPPVAEAPAITPAPVEEAELAELRNLMEMRGQAQSKVKGVKFSKKDEARYNELLPKYRSRLFETITPEADPVVWKDIQGNDIKVSQKGTFYTVENGRVRTGPAFQSEGFVGDVSPQPVSAAVVESNNVPLPEGYAKQGDLYVYQPAVSETITPAAEPAGKPQRYALQQLGATSGEWRTIQILPDKKTADLEQAKLPEGATGWRIIPEEAPAKRAPSKLRGQKGGILIPSREDFIQAGQNIYEAGMEFGTWAKQMIQQFGDVVRQFLADVWEAVSGFPAKLEEMAGYLPGKGERGAVTFGRGEEPPKKPAEPAPEKPIADPATPDEQTQELVQQAQEQESIVDSAVKEAGTTVFDVFNKLVNEGKTEDQVAKELGISNYDVRKYKLRADTAILNKMKQKKVKPLAFAPKNPVAEFAEKNLRKYFTKEGWLPKAVFQSWVKRNAALSREQKEAEFAIKDLYAGIREVFGISKMEMITKGLVSVPPEFVQQLNDAMAKKIDINTMPEPVREPLTRMRQHIDAMSRQLVDLNVLPDELSAKISENLGVYLTRSYKIFTDKNWINKIPAEKLTAARNFLYQQQLKNDPEATIEMADRELRNMLNDWASDAEGLRKRGGKLGAKDLSVMMERAKVPKVLREVMGENTNVIFNYANTIGKISRFVSDQKFLNEVKAKGTGEFLFTEKDAPKGFNTQIAAEESRTMSPLNGLRTTPEIAKAFEEFGKGYDARENPGLYVLAWLNAVGKLNLTVGSVLTQMRNMLGQPAFFVFNGHYNWRVIRQEIDAIAKEKGISQEDAKKELVKLAAAQGLVNENAYAGELRTAFQEVGLETFDDIGPDEFTKQFVLTRMYLKGVKSAQELYQKTDEFGKLVGWLNETKRIQRMNKGMDKQTAQSIAAERTRDTYPTYSQSSEALRLFRRQPFIGPFATFFYETFRTSFHNLRYAFEDINGPTPEHKAEGIKRLAGAMTTLSMGAFGINLLSKLASGIGDDEEEDVRRMLPPWAKDASLAWMPKSKDGTYNFINVSYINPYNAMTDPFIAMMSGFAKGDKPEEIAAQALGSFLSPFSSEQPVTATIADAMRNRTETGKQIYNPQDDITTKTSKIMLHIFGKTFTPGTINRLRERIIPAIQGETVGTRAPAPAKEIAAELTGIRFETLDMKAAFSNKAWEFSKAANESERIFRDVATRRRRVDEQEQVDAYLRSEQTRYEIWNDMYRDYMAVRRAGASQGEAVRLMTDIGISKKEAIAISKGRYVPYEVSNEVLRRSKLNENKVPIKEIRVIGKEMPRVLTDITKTP